MLYFKLAWMCLVSICTAVFVYPTLHELGHLLAAVMAGAEVLDFSVFPVPYVSMTMNVAEPLHLAAIGLCGMIFPVLCSMMTPKHLTSSVVVYVVRLVNVYAWLLSCLAIVLDQIGLSWKNEDVLTVIHYLNGRELTIFSFCVAFLLFCIFFFVKDKPIRRILSFF